MATRHSSIWGPRTHKVGQPVRCNVVARSGTSYTVKLVGTNEQAILEYQEVLQTGQEVLARIQSMDRRGLVLIPEFASTPTRGRAAQSGTYSVEQLHAQTQNSAPRSSFSCQRVFDLVPPAPPCERLQSTAPDFVGQFVCQMEGGGRNAIIKGSCQQQFSRFLMLFHNGRLVGCSYGKRGDSSTFELPTADAAKRALNDLYHPSSTLEIIDTPNGVILGLASLYLGEVLELPPMPDVNALFDAVGSRFQQQRLTGCVVVCDENNQSLAFVYAHEGFPVTCFLVRQQQLCSLNDLRSLLSAPGVGLRASILGPVSRSIGFSLGMLGRSDQLT
jgi:hypothetical protein